MNQGLVVPQSQVLVRARSLLFVPASRPERFAKALGSGADAVILDLEDAVAPEHKVAARTCIAHVWPQMDVTQRGRVLVRINPPGTPWHEDDLQLIESLPGLGALMLPKTQSCEELSFVQSRAPWLPLMPLIETAEGLAQIDRLARASMVIRLAFGHLDFQADLGMVCGEDQTELAPVRLAMVMASRRAGLVPPVDGICTSTNDQSEVAADAARSRRMGFTGKLCIHPAQLESIHQGFSPSAQERDWAERVLHAHVQAGSGAFAVDGKMVDAPVLTRARQIQEQSQRATLRSVVS